MTGKTHRIFGLTCGVGYYLASVQPQYSPATFGAVIVGSYLGALLPDIDQPMADIWDSLPFGHTIGKIPGAIIKHRHLSHSLLGLVVFNFLIFLILRTFPSYWGINTTLVLVSTIIAYASHLLADAFTVEGIPILYPWHRNFGLPPKPLDGIRIESGQWFENLVLFPAVTIALVVVIIANWHNIKLVLYK